MKNRKANLMEEGFTAYFDGLRLGDNPYERSLEKATMWDRGWNQGYQQALEGGTARAEPIEHPLEPGRKAYCNGLQDHDKPHPPGSEEWRKWSDGWHDADAIENRAKRV